MGREARERYITRPFATGALAFAIATATADDRELVESLFQDVRPPTSVDREPTMFSLMRTDAEGAAWEVGSRRVQGQRATTLASALNLLMADVNRSALDAEPEHLHLHAAAATNGGRAVVIAAERNTGKTTTVAHLVARGWGFVTDETVRLCSDVDDITGFPKPLSIKPGGRELVDHLEPWMVPAVGDGPAGYQFVSIGASGGKIVDRGEPDLVILLRPPLDWATSTSPVVRPLHPADAVVALMQETLDAERFGSAALRVARLATTSHCFELTIGSPHETVDEIERLFRLDPAEPFPISVLPPSDAFSPGVVTIAIEDRVVVHDTPSGPIFALDVGAARVWRQLGGQPVDDEVDIDSPAIRPLLTQLRTLGVLAGAA